MAGQNGSKRLGRRIQHSSFCTCWERSSVKLIARYNLPQTPKEESLSTYQARVWYKWQLSLISENLDYSKPLEQISREACDRRNAIRTNARMAMDDQGWAEYLMEEEENRTFEQIIARYQKRGYAGDDLWNMIIKSSMSSRQKIDTLFGIK